MYTPRDLPTEGRGVIHLHDDKRQEAPLFIESTYVIEMQSKHAKGMSLRLQSEFIGIPVSLWR